MARRAKIVCTMGLVTSSEQGIAALPDAGMNVARMNVSHGDQADRQVIYDRLRTAATSAGKALAILADLQGTKIRLGRFADGPPRLANRRPDHTITVDDITATRERAYTTYQGLAPYARPGDRLLIDDGNIGLVVTGVVGNDVHCTVTGGGPVSNN
jgi:pyruvate kinase